MYIAIYQKSARYHREEGGYYTEEQHLVEWQKVKHGKGRKKIRAMMNVMSCYYEVGVGTTEFYNDFEWILSPDGRNIDVTRGVIGQGHSIYLESNNKLGCHEIGFKPYQ